MPASAPCIASTLQSDSRRTLQRNASEFLGVQLPLHHRAAPYMSWCSIYPDMDAAFTRPPYSRVIRGVIEDWKCYPQYPFPDWTPDQVERNGVLLGYDHMELCTVYKVDILDSGKSKQESISHANGDEASTTSYWNWLQVPRPAGAHVRALFVENMTLQVLQMLGTKYNIEPSFFLFSANWIPSNYQDDPRPREGDHITIVLPFVRILKNQRSVERESPMSIQQQAAILDEMPLEVVDAPLTLRSGTTLVQDLLAIHMVRTMTTSTIVSYHPRSKLHKMSAKHLQSVLQRTHDSVHWSKILSISKDSTFVLIAILGYVLQTWDEAFEALYNCIPRLGNDVSWNSDANYIRELHDLQAHVLSYRMLLKYFRESVEFVGDTRNPVMGIESISDRVLMDKEIVNLLSEIDRLERQRLLLADWLHNVIVLSHTLGNIENRRIIIQRLQVIRPTGDSIIVKLLYFLSVFLPPYFLSCVYRMNVREFKPGTNVTLAQYVGAAIALTLGTVWIAIALQRYSYFHPHRSPTWRRIMWPIFYVYDTIIWRSRNL